MLSPRERQQRLRRICNSWFNSIELPASNQNDPQQWVMYTLTYKPGVQWEPHHISNFIKSLRNFHVKNHRDLVYFWVAEMQKRGAVHYHVLVHAPNYARVPMADKAGYWRWGMTRTERCRSSTIAYLSKYLEKAQPPGVDFPFKCRRYGYSRLYLNRERFIRAKMGAFYQLFGHDPLAKRIVKKGFFFREHPWSRFSPAPILTSRKKYTIFWTNPKAEPRAGRLGSILMDKVPVWVPNEDFKMQMQKVVHLNLYQILDFGRTLKPSLGRGV